MVASRDSKVLGNSALALRKPNSWAALARSSVGTCVLLVLWSRLQLKYEATPAGTIMIDPGRTML